jgi:penicillin-binding protein 1C
MFTWWRSRTQKFKIGSTIGFCSVVFFTWFTFALPPQIFNDPYSTILEDRKGKLLGAIVAADGQWRFPSQTEVPEKFKEALIQFEDKRFSNHWGVDALAMGRAVKQNVASGKIVSGGSTITMQVMRLSRKHKGRNIWNKMIEMLLATRLELRYSKEEILNLYAAHAPFGGNVVGLPAACARYFGNSASELSWAEAATLAVLPNEPALIHPGRNRDKLLAKRNRLLNKLLQAKKFDSLTYSLAIVEPLPDQPLALPNDASHLLWQSVKDGHAQQRVSSTLNYDYQIRATEILNRHAGRLFANHVYNGAILVADVKSGEVLAYVGNIASTHENQDQVNIITAPRSTGSILKPFLYAAMLEEGKMLPRTLIPDVPLELAGFAPENFSRQFDGAVHANEALIRSLNVPAVFELREYRHEKFHTLLSRMGMTSLKPSSHYGLTLILGGAESTLWDVASMYASMGRMLTNYFERPGIARYASTDIHPLQYIASQESEPILGENSVLSAGSLWATVEAMKELYRPGEESGWRNFSSTKPIAWKTGTSLGHRDAWAVGLTPDFVVAAWVGNADGEGRPGLTGTEAAAPIMLDVFSSLPGKDWFNKPNSELVEIPVCAASGMRAGEWCSQIDSVACPATGLNTIVCQYHKLIHLSDNKQFRVNSQCENIENMVGTGWFVLPPVQEYYFKQKNTSYKTMPAFRKDCLNPQSMAGMDIIYPKNGSQIYLPVELDGNLGKIVLQVAHGQRSASVYWHMDGRYIGQTKQVHQLTMAIEAGRHKLALMDDSGEVLEREFTVLSKP